jgi:hypothetical protein
MRWQRLSAATALAALVLLAAAGLADAVVVQSGNLRVSISTRLSPYRLPRVGDAPISAHIAGHIESVHGGVPPQLQEMDVLINRHGRLDFAGLPTCSLPQIQPGTNRRALRLCGDALVGSGHFWATVVFSENRPYHTTGRLMIFNGTLAGRPALFAHIYTTQPFPTSFVVPFAIRRVRRGPYGTELSASLPEALGDWGFVDRIKLNLGRDYTYRGRPHSYLNAGCPAPKGTRGAVFALAKASFRFADEEQLSAVVTKACGVSG